LACHILSNNLWTFVTVSVTFRLRISLCKGDYPKLD
jgi:hypothetical protein